jgi:lipopolysaccharide transport system permease protein
VLFKPEMNAAILTVVFGHLTKLPNQGVPYAVLVLSAAIGWQFFTSVMTESGGRIANNLELVSKVYFSDEARELVYEPLLVPS